MHALSDARRELVHDWFFEVETCVHDLFIEITIMNWMLDYWFSAIEAEVDRRLRRGHLEEIERGEAHLRDVDLVIRNNPMPAGNALIYQVLKKAEGVAEELTREIFREALIEQGFDCQTIHAGSCCASCRSRRSSSQALLAGTGPPARGSTSRAASRTKPKNFGARF